MSRDNGTQELSRQVAIDVMGTDLDRGMERGGILPPFDSDLGTAWQIVEQMARRYEGMKLKLLEDELGWRAVFADRALIAAAFEASGRTPAEAICQAALAAVKRMRRAPQGVSAPEHPAPFGHGREEDPL